MCITTLEADNGESGRRLACKIISVVKDCPDITSICDPGCSNGHIASRLASLGYNVTGNVQSDHSNHIDA